jgi:hypothetical protein
MKSFILSAATLFALAAAPATQAADFRSDIDPALRGEVKMHLLSNDGGKTSEPVDGKTLCYVSANLIRMANGSEFKVERVVIVRNSDGRPVGNLMQLDSGEKLLLETRENSPYVLLILYNGDGKEIRRAVVTIDN